MSVIAHIPIKLLQKQCFFFKSKFPEWSFSEVVHQILHEFHNPLFYDYL